MEAPMDSEYRLDGITGFSGQGCSDHELENVAAVMDAEWESWAYILVPINSPIT